MLLDLARTALAVAARAVGREALESSLARSDMAGLGKRRGAAFVTLTEDDALRGCMGVLDEDRPLSASVARAATLAAVSDPRFRQVELAEIGRLHIEVSILGPMHALADPLSFRSGVDGVIVERGERRGLLLPEVATMADMDPQRMLETCCRKAGLPPEAWSDPGTRVSAFRTCRFGGRASSEGASHPGPGGSRRSAPDRP